MEAQRLDQPPHGRLRAVQHHVAPAAPQTAGDHRQVQDQRGVGEAQGGSAMAVAGDGSLHLLERGFTDEAIMTDALDIEQTSIGCEAGLSSGKRNAIDARGATA